jgi:imidazole glycerol-phosphate synthase subunit HisH
MNHIVIIDYGMGNLGSVQRALEECGANCAVSSNPKDLTEATHIILPGVGAFTEGMAQLHQRGWVTAIREVVIDNRIPLLGICLGMQLLADLGHEGGNTPGLGLIPGEVCLLEPTSPKERIPHVGWNEITKVGINPLFMDIPDGSDFYYVHSYHFKAANSSDIIASTAYCGEFIAAVARDNVFGVQFHPEKSQRSGFQLLKNFLKQ